MHIALLTDGISPYVTGGMQRHSYHLARKLLENGVKLTLVHCVPFGEKLPSDEAVQDLLAGHGDRLTVIGLHFPKPKKMPGHYLRESYRYSCLIYEALASKLPDFDFIYAKGFTAWNLLERKKKGAHIAPIGVKFHGYEMFQKTKGFKSRAERFALRPPVVFCNRNASVIFSYGGKISEIIASIGVETEKVIEIGSAIDKDWMVETPKVQTGKRKFLFIGRNERRKGINELAECTPVFEKTRTEIHWIGPIPKLLRIESDANIYHGSVKNVEKLRELIDTCQILVLPSHSEGMPNVILEAMARGLAVIATDVGAVPMMVDQANGRLITPRDKNQLSAAIEELALMTDTGLDKLRRESLRRVKSAFNWDDVAKQTIAAIRQHTFSNGANHHHAP